MMIFCLAASGAPDAPIQVLNKGVGGSTTRNGLRRFAKDVEALKPDHLILYFGMNDALNSGKLVPLDAFTNNLQAMVDRARAIGVKTIIITTINPIVGSYVKQRHPKHPQSDLDAWLAAYDKAVRALAIKNNLPLADLRAAVLAHCPDPEAENSLVRNVANSHSRDGVHLTAAGYRVMAQCYLPLLAGRVKPGERIVCFGDSLTYGAHVKGAGTAEGETYPACLRRLLNQKNSQAEPHGR
jgi:lysophospholipase L1-like esterase